MASNREGRNKVKLYGLILSGGKSSRMGRDKGQLDYHGLPQRKHMFELASNCCEKVFYSIREDQISAFKDLPYIVDGNYFQGPINGILSAHEQYPNTGWLVLACDLPMLSLGTIKSLIVERDNSTNATVYATQQSKLPEPLVAIWEPNGLRQLKEEIVNNKVVGPRQFLINTIIKTVYPRLDEVLYNANSLEEYEKARTLLKKQVNE